MQRFRVRALPVGELTSIAEHLDVCPSCNDRFTDTLQSRRGTEPLKITLAPEFQFRLDHVDYEQLVRLADKTVDATEREMLDVHLKVCAPCQEDVRSFLAFREQMETETQLSPSNRRGRSGLGSIGGAVSLGIQFMPQRWYSLESR
jgi:hypothetical protein